MRGPSVLAMLSGSALFVLEQGENNSQFSERAKFSELAQCSEQNQFSEIAQCSEKSFQFSDLAQCCHGQRGPRPGRAVRGR